MIVQERPFNHEGVFLSKDNKGSWLQTGSGARVSVLDPTQDQMLIEDIVPAISKQCRFNGHCAEFYSVAQHCVLGAKFALKEFNENVAREFLLHDATEAYVGDLIRPIKVVLPEFNTIEQRFTEAIAERFGIAKEMTPEVHFIDNVMVTWEKRDLLPNSEPWPRLPDITPYNFPLLKGWSWKKSEKLYWKMFKELF